MTEKVGFDWSMEHGSGGGSGAGGRGGGGFGSEPSSNVASLTKGLTVRVKGRGRVESVCIGLTELILQRVLVVLLCVRHCVRCGDRRETLSLSSSLVVMMTCRLQEWTAQGVTVPPTGGK